MKQPRISKEELEKADPNLLPPTQNIEEDLARGDSSLVPDPDDIPGGWDSTLNQQITKRSDMEQAEGQALQSQQDDKTLEQMRKEKKRANKH